MAEAASRPRSHKPIVWGLFAGGGTFTAFVLPIMIVLTGLAIPIGILSPAVFEYDRVHAFASNWLGKLVLLGFIFLPLWHAAHRLRITAHDFGIRADGPLSWILYGLAGLGTLVTLFSLLSI